MMHHLLSFFFYVSIRAYFAIFVTKIGRLLNKMWGRYKRKLINKRGRLINKIWRRVLRSFFFFFKEKKKNKKSLNVYFVILGRGKLFEILEEAKLEILGETKLFVKYMLSKFERDT